MFDKIQRTFKIIRKFSEYLILNRINKHVNKSLGIRLRELFEELGVTFVKIGQLLSTRYDILKEKDCKELQKLLDDTKPLKYSLIRELVKYELKKYPEELFLSFESKPLASASMSQVHKAVLHSGEKVVVKIRRPKIERTIKLDLAIFRNISYIAMLFSGKLRHIRINKIVSQMREWLLEEVDFETEIKNIELLRKEYDFGYYKKFRPDLGMGHSLFTYPKFCSKNIITMNYIDGIPLIKKHLVENDPEYDIYKSVKTYISAATNRLFQDKAYYFQGDPHPANILILKNGDVANIDCGLTGYFSLEEVRKVNRLFLAVYSNHLDGTIRAALDICNADYKKYAPRIKNDIEKYLEKCKDEGVGYWFMEVIRIFTKHRVPFPHSLVLFGRMNMVLDGLIHIVDPDAKTLKIFGEDLQKALKKKIIKNILEADYYSVMYKLSEKAKESPEKIIGLIDRYYENPLKIIRDIKREINA